MRRGCTVTCTTCRRRRRSRWSRRGCCSPRRSAAEHEHLRKERDGFRDQRNAVFATNEQLLSEVQESDQARLRAENETRAVRREADALRARVIELEQLLAEAPVAVTLTERAVESADRLTAFFAPTQALREDSYDGPLRHSYLISRDLPETGGGV
jgi:hypothetical protein